MGVGKKDENRKKEGGEKSRKVWTSKPPLFFFLHERRRSINTMIITVERERKRERMCVLHFDYRTKRERERRWKRVREEMEEGVRKKMEENEKQEVIAEFSSCQERWDPIEKNDQKKNESERERGKNTSIIVITSES